MARSEASKPLPCTWVVPPPSPKGSTKRLPTVFGRKERPEWKAPKDDRDRALLAAAQTQHRLARGVRAFRDRLGLTTEDVAATIGMSPDHLRKILRGAAHVGLTDLHLIADAVGSRIDARIKVGREG